MKRDRLKEIKEWKDEIDLHGNEISERNFLTLHVEWLIEQAERVEELEEEVQDISVWNHGHRCHIHKLKQQNERYREALEFYANRDNYKLEHFDPNLEGYMSTVDYDEGQKARKELEGEE